MFLGPETRVIDGNLQVQVPAPASPASYYVLAEGPNSFDGVHGTFEVSPGGTAPPASMSGGDRLYPGQDVYSPNGGYRLTYQTDGDLVLYAGGSAVWATMTFATPGYVEMQTDGNFVIYDAWGAPVWHTWTFGNPGASLSVQDDGRIVVYSSGGSELWGS